MSASGCATSQQQLPSSNHLDLPFPYLFHVPKIYYWKQTFSQIVGTLFVSFDFIYFRGEKATLVPTQPVAGYTPSSVVLNSANKVLSVFKPQQEKKVLEWPVFASEPVNVDGRFDPSLSFILSFENVCSVRKETFLLTPCLCLESNSAEGGEKVGSTS